METEKKTEESSVVLDPVNQFYARLEKDLTTSYKRFKSREIINCLKEQLLEVGELEAFYPSIPCLNQGYLPPIQCSNSLEQFIENSILEIRHKRASGVSRIEITGFLVRITAFLQKLKDKETPINYFFILLKEFALATLGINNTDSVVIHVLNGELLKEVARVYCFEPNLYVLVTNLLLNAIKITMKSKVCPLLYPPEICMLYGVGLGNADRIIEEINNTYATPIEEIIEDLDNVRIYDFGVSLKTYLNKFEFLSDNTLISASDFLLQLKKKYGSSVNRRERKVKTYKNLTPFKITTLCVNTNLYLNTPLENFSTVHIYLEKGNLNSLDRLVSYAALLNRIRVENHIKFTKNPIYSSCKIIIHDMTDLSQKIINKLNTITKELSEAHNIQFSVEVYYAPTAFKKDTKKESIQSVLVISDIHSDYNKKQQYLFNLKDDFIINCGDTSGSATKTIDWVKTNMKYGLLTHGNHLGYADSTPIEDQIEQLKEAFPLDSDVSYLNNSYKIYNGIVFIGACLYTDFELYGLEKIESYMQHARIYMNDFRLPRRRLKNEIRFLIPDDYITWHRESMNYISETTLKFINNPVVIFTHFAPLPFSIAPKYKNNPLNPAFASNISYLLEKRPNIVLWCHGHMHNYASYMYHKRTRIHCAPFGYYTEREHSESSLLYPKDQFTFSQIKDRLLYSPELKNYTEKDWQERIKRWKKV